MTRCILLFLPLLLCTLGVQAQTVASVPRDADRMTYFEYRSICLDTDYVNDTIETVRFVQHRRRNTETARELKVYSNRQLVHSRTYANSTWCDFYYAYDARGRLVKREKRDASGTLLSCVYITFSGDTVRCSSSNANTNHTYEAVTDAEGHLLGERSLHNGECIGWQKYAWTHEDYLHGLHILNCDKISGAITDTIESIFTNDSARVTTCVFFATGKAYRTDVAQSDSLHGYTKIERTTDAGHNGAGTTTSTFRHYDTCAEFLGKTETVTTSSTSRKVEHSCTVWRKTKWPQDDTSKRKS